jgi:glycine/serine hydroxymethyltransferase
VYFADS